MLRRCEKWTARRSSGVRIAKLQSQRLELHCLADWGQFINTRTFIAGGSAEGCGGNIQAGTSPGQLVISTNRLLI